jgi:hypothetical protein
MAVECVEWQWRSNGESSCLSSLSHFGFANVEKANFSRGRSIIPCSNSSNRPQIRPQYCNLEGLKEGRKGRRRSAFPFELNPLTFPLPLNPRYPSNAVLHAGLLSVTMLGAAWKAYTRLCIAKRRRTRRKKAGREWVRGKEGGKEIEGRRNPEHHHLHLIYTTPHHSSCLVARPILTKSLTASFTMAIADGICQVSMDPAVSNLCNYWPSCLTIFWRMPIRHSNG